MTFFEKSPKGPVSGGIIIWSCTSKIAEMNDSDRELFKTSKNFEIGSVENFVRLPAISEKSNNSVKSRIFVMDIQGTDPKTVPSYRISQKSTKVF